MASVAVPGMDIAMSVSRLPVTKPKIAKSEIDGEADAARVTVLRDKCVDAIKTRFNEFREWKSNKKLIESFGAQHVAILFSSVSMPFCQRLATGVFAEEKKNMIRETLKSVTKQCDGESEDESSEIICDEIETIQQAAVQLLYCAYHIALKMSMFDYE